VDFDAAFSISVVRNQSQLSKLVHKKAHPGAGGSNHLRKRLLTDFAMIVSGLDSLPKFANSRSRRTKRFSLEVKS